MNEKPNPLDLQQMALDAHEEESKEFDNPNAIDPLSYVLGFKKGVRITNAYAVGYEVTFKHEKIVMTPKEKALKLCQSFGITTLFAQDCNGGVTLPLSIAKKCAMIAVDEIEKAIKNDQPDDPEFQEMYENYWLLVKTEIEKL